MEASNANEADVFGQDVTKSGLFAFVPVALVGSKLTHGYLRQVTIAEKRFKITSLTTMPLRPRVGIYGKS